MTNMSRFFECYSHARKHMYGTVFLNIASIFNHNLAPVAPDRSSRPDINIPSDNHIAGYRCLWMDEGSFVDDGLVGVKFVDQGVMGYRLSVIRCVNGSFFSNMITSFGFS